MELCSSVLLLAARCAQNMRESRSNHTKEGFVYLNVMSAAEEPHDPGNSIPQPPAQERGAGIGRKSGNDTEVAEQDEPNLRHPTNSHPSESELETSAHENTKSAFVIMSVSAFDATEDLEQSKGMSHEADSFIEDKHRGQSESSESDEMMRGTLVAPLPDKEQISEFNERGLPIEGAANGPVAAPIPRRFRRVNKYERGRWVIEDALEHGETDERPESEMRGAYTNQNSSSSKGSTGNVVLGRESPYSQRKKGGEGGGGGGGDDLVHLHSRSSSDVGGQGLDSGGTGDNCHADRGSVVGGETTSNLSRNTSMSSLTTAGDKSVDGDHSSDRLSQLKDESESEITYPQTHTSAGHVTQSAVSSPLQQHRHSEASAGTSAVPTATNPTGTSASDSVGEENQ